MANLKEIFVSILADQLDTYTSQQKVREVGFGIKFQYELKTDFQCADVHLLQVNLKR